ncbi:MAG TPA: M14 family zinc carboxypeptidase, partial [Candidatus Methylomirabilis sp.]
MKLVLALAALLQAAPADTSDAPFTAILSPGTLYDAAIPTLKRVVGHDFNQEITAPEDILRYMEALAAAAPDRTHLFPYATSWEGRPLVMMVIGSRERMARLDEIRADLATLADPRGLSEADGEALLARLPVVTALMHGVHGNEITSSGAAMAEAYHLLAARNDTTVDRIRSESLVIVDPVENPDGRARFVLHQLMDRSRWPDPLSWSAEHDEPWPGGRVNHYLFDMNRDLFIQSQPETRGKTAAFLEWRPQIVADLHEMGGNSTYFFPPTAPPENPWFTD